MSRWRCAWGLGRLKARINRRFWQVDAFLGVGLPLVLLAVFSPYVAPGARTRLVVGTVVLAALLAVPRRTMLNVVEDRVFGFRHLLGTTALTPHTYLAGSTLGAAVTVLPPLVVALAGPLLAGVPGPSSWTWLAPYALLSAALVASGLWLASLSFGWHAMLALSNLLVMGSLALCPLLYPAQAVPAVLRPLVRLLPPSLGAELMAAGWQARPLPLGDVCLLGGWALALLLVALRRFARMSLLGAA